MRRNAFSLPMVSCLFFTLTTGLAQACAEREAAINAVEAGDFVTAEGFYEQILVSPDCDDAMRDWLAQQLANESLRVALFEAQTDAERQTALERALTFEEHWRAYWGLGRIARGQGDRNQEAFYLQTAINRLNDGPQEHEASETEIRQLLAEATVATQLADGVVETPRTRSGTLGGIFSAEVRGFVVEEVTLNIEFEFDSAELTPNGQELALLYLQSAIEQGQQRIVVEGHTDPVGDAGYNMGLSIRRAEAVRDFLAAQQSFDGQIVVRGQGETELPPLPEGFAADSDEYYQLARRVVFERT